MKIMKLSNTIYRKSISGQETYNNISDHLLDIRRG